MTQERILVVTMTKRSVRAVIAALLERRGLRDGDGGRCRGGADTVCTKVLAAIWCCRT